MLSMQVKHLYFQNEQICSVDLFDILSSAFTIKNKLKSAYKTALVSFITSSLSAFVSRFQILLNISYKWPNIWYLTGNMKYVKCKTKS